MALLEGAARTILPGQPHRVALGHQRTEGQGLCRGPVKTLASFEHALALVSSRRPTVLCSGKPSGVRRQGALPISLNALGLIAVSPR